MHRSFTHCLTLGQEKSEIAVTSPQVKTSTAMKISERIKKALEDSGSSQSAVAEICNVTPTSVGRWLKWLDEDTITDDQWGDFARGLKAVGLSPEEYRPLPVPKPRLRMELLPLLNLFPDKKEHLEALIKIASSDDAARDTLLLVLQDRLTRMK